MNTICRTVDEYIKMFDNDIQAILEKIRATIVAHAPGAAECIAYGMPAYKINGKPLVYFAAYKMHIGFYATPTGHAAFKEQLSLYKQGKGSVQFPLDKPIPYDLVKQIVEFRVKEISSRKARKRKVA
jgi:uncharacterized protein YdhG (YjbR/CyaY superfamily)